MKVRLEKHTFELNVPFAIAGNSWSTTQAVHVVLEHGDAVGRGEGVGVYYMNETVDDIIDQLDRVASQIELDPRHDLVDDLLPPGGARNALDCAFWDLRAKTEGRRVWELLGINTPRPLRTVYTIGIDEPSVMASRAVESCAMPALKIKLDADNPVQRIEKIRGVRPDASIIVDANQSWTFDLLSDVSQPLADLGVEMIEQPLPRGGDESLVQYKSPVPLGADESCLHTAELEWCTSRYDVINIKLDKTGGLTEAMRLIERCRDGGLELMVGNMTGTSLSMAPNFVVGQFCSYVDIDGPLLLREDVDNGLEYSACGMVEAPTRALWG